MPPKTAKKAKPDASKKFSVIQDDVSTDEEADSGAASSSSAAAAAPKGGKAKVAKDPKPKFAKGVAKQDLRYSKHCELLDGDGNPCQPWKVEREFEYEGAAPAQKVIVNVTYRAVSVATGSDVDYVNLSGAEWNALVNKAYTTQLDRYVMYNFATTYNLKDEDDPTKPHSDALRARALAMLVIPEYTAASPTVVGSTDFENDGPPVQLTPTSKAFESIYAAQIGDTDLYDPDDVARAFTWKISPFEFNSLDKAQ